MESKGKRRAGERAAEAGKSCYERVDGAGLLALGLQLSLERGYRIADGTKLQGSVIGRGESSLVRRQCRSWVSSSVGGDGKSYQPFGEFCFESAVGPRWSLVRSIRSNWDSGIDSFPRHWCCCYLALYAAILRRDVTDVIPWFVMKLLVLLDGWLVPPCLCWIRMFRKRLIKLCAGK